MDKPAGAKDLTTSTRYHARMVPVGARVVTLGIFSQLYPQISQPISSHAVKETLGIRFLSLLSGAHEPCLKLIHPPTK